MCECMCTGGDKGECFLCHVCPKRAGNRGFHLAADAPDSSEEEGARKHDLHFLRPGTTHHPHHLCMYLDSCKTSWLVNDLFEE